MSVSVIVRPPVVRVSPISYSSKKRLLEHELSPSRRANRRRRGDRRRAALHRFECGADELLAVAGERGDRQRRVGVRFRPPDQHRQIGDAFDRFAVRLFVATLADQIESFVVPPRFVRKGEQQPAGGGIGQSDRAAGRDRDPDPRRAHDLVQHEQLAAVDHAEVASLAGFGGELAHRVIGGAEQSVVGRMAVTELEQAQGERVCTRRRIARDVPPPFERGEDAEKLARTLAQLARDLRLGQGDALRGQALEHVESLFQRGNVIVRSCLTLP